MSKLGSEKAEAQDIKLPTFTGSQRRQGNSRKKTYLCFIDYTKVYNYVDDNELWKTKSWEYQTNSLVSWEACMPVKKQQLEPYMGQLIGSGLRKEYDKAVYWHSILIYTQSTS